MKQLIVLLSLITVLTSCGSGTNSSTEPTATSPVEDGLTRPDSTNWTTVQWLDSVQNFGKVTDGEKVIITFHFKNTGTKPLVISNVQASCGCTVPSKPEEPIAPGAEGKITAEFNSEGRVGKATKNITVSANIKEGITSLLFEGEVLPKK